MTWQQLELQSRAFDSTPSPAHIALSTHWSKGGTATASGSTPGTLDSPCRLSFNRTTAGGGMVRGGFGFRLGSG
jgi:hypothetical protein